MQCTKDSALIINSGVFEGGERSVQAWGEAAIYGGTFLGSVEAWASVVDGVTYGSSIAILGGVFEGPLKTGLYPPDSTVTEYPASIVISGGKFRYDPSEYVQNLGSEYMVTGPVDGYYSVVEYESPEYIPPVYIPPAPVKIPISGDSNSISVNVSISGSVASIDNVDTSQLDGVIGGEAGAQGISVDFSGLSTRVTNVKIPSSVIGQVSDALSDSGNDSEGLKIILPSGTFIEFGAEALKNVASQIEGGDLSLTVLPAGKAPLTDEQREAVGDRPAYDFSLMAGANRISDLGGSVKLGIPYTLGPDERPVNLSALYVAELGETERCESDYSLENQHLVLRTHHFSLYMIGYEEASDFDTCLKDAVCPITPFSDASARAWYHDGVHWALDWGVLKGYGTNGEGGLGPNDFTTRAQVAVMLHRYAQDCGYDVSVGADTNVLSFEDFAEIRTWSMEAIQWAVSEGVLRGYGDGSVLGPNDNVTREQLAVMLHRFAHAYDIDVSVGEDTNILSYADAFDIGEYAIPAMQWACGSGVIRGYDDGSDCLGPKDGASRAQVATMIMRFDSIA
ncbi:MAG: S-layer homology domain-containing protein [Eggerthellaceae bacterium]|nr:S-layer homology domain-containing protein [Eggerthellaceae bacterium]